MWQLRVWWGVRCNSKRCDELRAALTLMGSEDKLETLWKVHFRSWWGVKCNSGRWEVARGTLELELVFISKIQLEFNFRNWFFDARLHPLGRPPLSPADASANYGRPINFRSSATTLSCPQQRTSRESPDRVFVTQHSTLMICRRFIIQLSGDILWILRRVSMRCFRFGARY